MENPIKKITSNLTKREYYMLCLVIVMAISLFIIIWAAQQDVNTYIKAYTECMQSKYYNTTIRLP